MTYAQKLFLRIVVVVSVILLATSTCFAQLRSAPINPAYIEYLDQLARGMWPMVTEDGHGLGEIPHPVMPPKGPVRIDLPMALPDTYDLRSIPNKVPAILDQGACGACWTFATFASMETCARPTNTWDFSENHLKNLHGWDWTCCAGGNPWVSAAYLARWAGPVWESEDLYNPSSCTSPGGLTARRHIQNINWLPAMTSGTDTTNRDIIQSEIIANGGVYANYYSSSTYYYLGPGGTAFYHPTATTTNHAVCIVGWDNNYDKTNFLPGTQPPGNGAWLVRNSWGNTWTGNSGNTVGDNGYFWASYYDSKFAKDTVAQFQNTRDTTNFQTQYSYDPLGWISNLNSPYAANIFTRSGGTEKLEAVGFYTCYHGCNYTISVYKNCTSTNPTSGTLAATTSGTCTYTGYHTAWFASPPTLGPTDTRFSIVTYITGGPYPSAFEYAISGVTSGATASAGQSFYSFDGSSWTDLTTYNSTANFCIKGFSNPVAPPTLAWVGTNGYASDGVDPDTGNPSGGPGPTTFTFKVKYTDGSGAAPTSAYCRIQKLGADRVWRRIAKPAMTKESGNIATGAIYSCTAQLPNETLRYCFVFKDSSGNPVGGDPANYIQGSPTIIGRPHIGWIGGDWKFAEDGVHPNTGNVGETFWFRVRYWDSEGDAPTKAKLQVQRDGVIGLNKTMDAGPSGNLQTGTQYSKSAVFSVAGDREYRFIFYDNDGKAIGEPSTWHPFKVKNGSSSSPSMITALAAVPTAAGAQVTFTLAGAANVTATVLNVAGRPIRTIVADKSCRSGLQSLLWDCKAENGLTVPAGLYLIRLTARTEEGAQSSGIATLSLR
ncbi:MAG: lectin like domain-containing protein [Candidatus Zipacnadales bacterium]